MTGYEHLPGFEHLYLEDSWVLGVHESADELRFDVEAVLTEDHPEWHPPKTDAVHTYKRLSLVFPNTRNVTWAERMTGPPAVDASGEADYGHIDVFYVGRVRVRPAGRLGPCARRRRSACRDQRG
jgi:hypothetical protein